MTDRVPGAPGQYKATITTAELQKLQAGETFTITLTRDDQPTTEGTPYSKAAVLPDNLAALLCPDIIDPTPAQALEALQKLAAAAQAAANAAQTTANNAMPKAGGAFTGNATAAASTDESAAKIHNIIVVEAGTDPASLSVPAGTIIMVKK